MGGPDGHRIDRDPRRVRAGRRCRRTAGPGSTTPDAVAVVASYATVIAGGGPAGLTAAYELTKHGHPCVVLEADPNLVGGISRTDQYKGYRFDIGGHRFFSKSDEVNRHLARDPRRPVHHPVAAEPDLLQPQVLPLPAQAGRRPAQARPAPVGR